MKKESSLLTCRELREPEGRQRVAAARGNQHPDARDVGANRQGALDAERLGALLPGRDLPVFEQEGEAGGHERGGEDAEPGALGRQDGQGRDHERHPLARGLQENALRRVRLTAGTTSSPSTRPSRISTRARTS